MLATGLGSSTLSPTHVGVAPPPGYMYNGGSHTPSESPVPPFGVAFRACGYVCPAGPPNRRRLLATALGCLVHGHGEPDIAEPVPEGFADARRGRQHATVEW